MAYGIATDHDEASGARPALPPRCGGRPRDRRSRRADGARPRRRDRAGGGGADRHSGRPGRARLPAVEVLDADARTWDYASLAAPAGGRVLIVGNLPYSVGKPILMALIGARAAIHEMALMLQREAAERVDAPPGR